MPESTYLKPPWFVRVVGNRMAPLFKGSIIRHLSVLGRRSGQWRTVPVVVLDHDGERYLVAPRGNTEWARNLRASGTGRLTARGKTEEFTAVEVPAAERAPIVEAYVSAYGKMPGVAAIFRRLPDPADHPTFRIVGAQPL